MDALAGRLADGLDDGAGLSVAARQRVFAALVRASVRAHQDGEEAPPFADGDLTAEEVVVVVAAMLRTAGVTSFELAALFGV